MQYFLKPLFVTINYLTASARFIEVFMILLCVQDSGIINII